MRVLWLTPDKPANISVGRRRIADHLEPRGIEVVLRGTTPRTVFASIRDRDRYDAVIGTTRLGAIAGVGLARLGGIPLIVDHVDPIRQFAATAPTTLATGVRWLENAAFALAAHVLYVYPEEKARVRRFAPAASKTDLGVEYDRFADPSEETIEAARSRLDALDLEERIAVYVGGLEPIYHVRELLASVEFLEGWSLLVLGTGSLSELVSRATERSNVAFLGTVPHEQVPGYLHVADVGICLVDDPYTLKVLEYGAAGLPVVQLAGRAEERFSGLVQFTPPEPAAIARAVERADGRREPDVGVENGTSRSTADGSETEARSLRAFARRFDWERIADDYERALTEVV